MNCVLSFTQEQSDLLMKIKNKLDSIHHGELEPAGYLLAFLDADAMRHFLAHATVQRPARVRFTRVRS